MSTNNKQYSNEVGFGIYAPAGTAHLNATLQSIDEMANADVEMQSPLSEQLTIIVLDTNVLLEFLNVVQTFVAEVEQRQLPVLLIIPGAVIYELDGQKNRKDLSWFARLASTWLLKKVKERKSVRSQALEETCKPSGNWKKKETGVEFGMERTNDTLILDCCQYFFRKRQHRTFLCSKDKLLAVEAESSGISSIFPDRGSFCSRDLAQAVLGYETARFQFSGYHPVYRNDSMDFTQDNVATVDDGDGMDVDDDAATSQILHPSHPLDLLHLQVIEHFTELLVQLVARVAGPEAAMFGTTSESQHAPSYTKKNLMFWRASDCLEYLGMKKRRPSSNPRLEIFLTKPRDGKGARRGQDWSRRDWEVGLNGLAGIGEQWDEGRSVRESVLSVEVHMRRVFAMPMRPTGL
ncbi:PIN domain-containing protein [Phlebopus sp. FC_14]|nr:PIN domain-containing protein [Phlebopus sp. FC_14]